MMIKAPATYSFRGHTEIDLEIHELVHDKKGNMIGEIFYYPSVYVDFKAIRYQDHEDLPELYEVIRESINFETVDGDFPSRLNEKIIEEIIDFEDLFEHVEEI